MLAFIDHYVVIFYYCLFAESLVFNYVSLIFGSCIDYHMKGKKFMLNKKAM